METVEEKITETETPATPLFTVRQFANKNPFVSEGGLRYQIFNAETNGLAESGAIVRIGRKVLINSPKYFKWIYDGQKGRVD